MLRALESRQGLTSYAVTSIDDLDLPVLVALLDEAWQADYPQQARVAFDEPYLRWLLGDPEPDWVGVLLCTPAGRPVGFEVALERTLYCRQQAFRAYYATLFGVSPTQRRRGLGRWLIETLSHLVFAERGADLIFATFHAQHGGLRASQSTYDRNPDWGARSFPPNSIWGQRLGTVAVSDSSTNRAFPVTRVVCPAGATALTPVADGDGLAVPALPSVAVVNETLRAQYQMAFGLGGTFRAQYLSPGASDAGVFWFEADRAQCAISFHVSPVARDAQTVGLLGQIQTVHAARCTPEHLRQALHHVCQFFRERQCYGATILDQGVVPHEVLEAVRFRPTHDRRIFVVRGPGAILAPFAEVSPPYCLDIA